mmetsp:Transcript_43893/g.72497  ORF Transcript_43893/g.72497 Transcript_43893/m.72497 type:complete len:282 (+) Transcript_43893:1399-2244(+)
MCRMGMPIILHHGGGGGGTGMHRNSCSVAKFQSVNGSVTRTTRHGYRLNRSLVEFVHIVFIAFGDQSQNDECTHTNGDKYDHHVEREITHTTDEVGSRRIKHNKRWHSALGLCMSRVHVASTADGRQRRGCFTLRLNHKHWCAGCTRTAHFSARSQTRCMAGYSGGCMRWHARRSHCRCECRCGRGCRCWCECRYERGYECGCECGCGSDWRTTRATCRQLSRRIGGPNCWCIGRHECRVCSGRRLRWRMTRHVRRYKGRTIGRRKRSRQRCRLRCGQHRR